MPGDLHNHSTCSDGSVPIYRLPILAARAGLDAMALSDHDTLRSAQYAYDHPVQDGVRPLGTAGMIRRVAAAAALHGAAVPVVEAVDSFRETEGEPDAEGVVPSRIVDRRRLRIVQTPQFFRAEVLRRAYETEYRAEFTDDASVVEAAGYRVCLAEGERGNLKLTTPEDFTVAEALIAAREEAGEERATTDAEHL